MTETTPDGTRAICAPDLLALIVCATNRDLERAAKENSFVLGMSPDMCARGSVEYRSKACFTGV